MSTVNSPASAPPAHENVRKIQSSTKSPLDKNNNSSLVGPGQTLNSGREISQMITGQVNAANLIMDIKKVSIFV